MQRDQRNRSGYVGLEHDRGSRRQGSYADSVDHFQTFFGCIRGSVGLRAAGLFEGGSAQVWDQARLSRLFDSLLDDRMLELDHKLREIGPIMAAFRAAHPDEWWTGYEVFCPRGRPGELEAVLSRAYGGGSLVGLVLMGEPLRREWVRRMTGRRTAECTALYKAARKLEKDEPTKVEEAGELYEMCVEIATRSLDPSSSELLDFAMRQAEPSLNDKHQIFFAPLRKHAEQQLDAALRTYQAFLEELHQAEIDGARRLAS